LVPYLHVDRDTRLLDVEVIQQLSSCMLTVIQLHMWQEWSMPILPHDGVPTRGPAGQGLIPDMEPSYFASS
jgi:hypothetical protein